MKKQILILLSIACISNSYAQSYTIKGSLTPTKNSGITILPNSSIVDPNEKTTNFVERKTPQRVYKTSLQPQLITIGPGTVVLPVKEYNSYSKETITYRPNYELKANTSNDKLTQPPIVKKEEQVNQPNNNSLRPLTEPTKLLATENPLTDNIDFRSLTDVATPLNNASTELTSLEPLTAYTPNFKEKETIDPALIKQPELTALTNGTEKKVLGRTLPELAPIEAGTKTVQKNSELILPELAPIEGGISNQKTSTGIPELAPIETEQSQRSSSGSKGLTIPTGVKLSSEKGSSYIFKPITIVEQKQNTSSTTDYVPYRNKPSAGGGFVLPELAPIEKESVAKDNVIPALAPIEKMEAAKEIAIPELAPLPKENNNFEAGIPSLAPLSGEHYQQPVKTNASKKNVPCVHVHAPDCPCYHAPTVTKTTPKKKYTTSKKKTTNSPKVIYVYRDAPKPVQTTERIVYVPQEHYVETKQEEQEQKQEKILYRDYTNAYNKQTQQNSKPVVTTKPGNLQEAQKYYNPSNYAQGLTAGPTSGDYPMTSSNVDANMRYTFHVGERGKYGVSVYNDVCYIMLSQNGKVIEYRSSADPQYGKPKLNFFGAPTNVAGIPIEYNYNRSVSKIGNVKFEYDFEGFFKKVGPSNVLYTSKSSISNVDNIYIRYDGSGNVASVDPNIGLVQLNNPIN